MSFLFYDPVIPNPGLIHSGWRGSGGLGLGADGQLVPHFNLSALSNRDYVTEYGYVEGLIPPSLPETSWLRPPGHLRGDQNLDKMRNHNLLATQKLDDEINIWLVNESSDRKMIEEFKADTTFDENDDFILSRDVRVSNTHVADDSIEELRLCNISNKAVWLRHKRSLYCLSSNFDESSCIFMNSVRVFEEHKYLEGEVFILDMSGMIWSGEIDHTLGRTKNMVGDGLNLITQSEHPRVIYAANDFQIRTVDIRGDSKDSTRLLFEVPKMNHRGFTTGEFVQTPIVHMKSLPDREHYIIAINDRQFFLIDERYPCSALLTQYHSIPDGSHVLQLAPAVADTSHSDRFIHNQFFLDHGITGVWMSSLYEQKTALFSSIRPIHRMKQAEDAFSVLCPPTSSPPYKADSPPRAISLIQGFKDKKNRPIDILLSALDDGAVLYSKLLYGESDTSEIKTALKFSRRRFMDFVYESAEEMEAWGTYYERTDKDKICETVSVKFEIPENDETWDPTNTHPLKFQAVDPGFRLEPLVPSNPDAIISSSILSLWSSEICGFRGTLGCANEEGIPGPGGYDAANLAQTYSSLLSLAIVGDDFSRVDKAGILDTIRKSQKEDGSFWSQGANSESDMRFVYCAVAICHILGDDSVIDWVKLSKFIRDSFNYDGGLGQLPGNESHGGSTYCAVASLALANKLWDQSVLTNKEIDRLIKWALWKQNEGFHGRAHKPDDSCYAFWIGATLEILNAHPLANQESLRKFLMISQHNFFGGFCKVPEKGSFSDILHTYFSIAALSLLREPSFGPVFAPLNVSRRAYENILRSQKNMK